MQRWPVLEQAFEGAPTPGYLTHKSTFISNIRKRYSGKVLDINDLQAKFSFQEA